MVDRPGLEPGSLSLRGWTSPSKFAIYLERVLGLEPKTTESKSVELPLLHTRIKIILYEFLKNICFISSRDVLYTIYDYLYTVWKTIFQTCVCLFYQTMDVLYTIHDYLYT